jgi:hypothetical protein
MSTFNNVFLTLPDCTRQTVTVMTVRPGRYAVAGAEGVADIEQSYLSFCVDELPEGFLNLDDDSDSMKLFGRSEWVRGPDVSILGGMMVAPGLVELQKALDQLRGSFIPQTEYRPQAPR